MGFHVTFLIKGLVTPATEELGHMAYYSNYFLILYYTKWDTRYL
jgi:hypothetical protein